MRASEPGTIRAQDAVSLEDKYTAGTGRVFLSGTQALVRLCLDQRARDESAGLRTGGFISGYRGSPLGNFDMALWGARDHLARHNIVFRPGVNEEIAATSCWGTQQAGFFPGPKYDGVFAVWYGKGPGVDRCGDALKHGNLAGTSPHGGVLVLAGDDHGAKSSTTAHQSEQALIAAMIPVLYPATVQEYLDFGAYAFALSRFTGLWVGFKCTTEVVETSATVTIKNSRIVLPDFDMPEGGLNIHPGFSPVADEARMVRYRLPAAQAFVAANGLDRIEVESVRRTLGIVTSGKAYTDTLQALEDLGLDARRTRQLGIRLYKLAMTWPVEPAGLQRFAAGHRELLVVEEKRPVIEPQVARILYNAPAADHPQLTGERDEAGAPLLPSDGELSPRIIADTVVRRLEALGLADVELLARHAVLTGAERRVAAPAPPIQRTPAFCSGCPHSTSTRLPEGSVALSGIGCHTMVLFMTDRPTMPPTQMGGEGANWIGAAPFTDTPHVFQNLGDGTYFHSGLLAIRAAVASGVNITYKILFNDAVAMTGGQPVDGALSVRDIVAQVQAEGVKEIVVVTDEPQKYKAREGLSSGVTIRHRDDLIAVEKRLRTVRGVSALIYDQTCAAEKRRRRKRNQFPDPPKRYFINELVCEGCGDCSVQSNCVSIQPMETEFGRKRRIDQSSCNKDYTCVKGFCPSFVTVLGGRLRRQGGGLDDVALKRAVDDLGHPDTAVSEHPYSILIAGIGGTGVVTIGSVLGMAARIEGLDCSVLDITGLSQKNGAVMSHLKLTGPSQSLNSARIGFGQSDLILGCDLIVAGAPEALNTIKPGKSSAVVNSHLVPTAAFQQAPDMDFCEDGFRKVLEERFGGRERTHFMDATKVAERVFRNHLAANMFLTGLAFQDGHIPICADAILKSIGLNGVAVEMNRQAFQLGRLAAADNHTFKTLTGLGENASDDRPVEPSLDDLIDRRAAFLTNYQDAAYAQDFRAFVDEVRRVAENHVPGRSALAEAVARYLFKLMAYKDEYEVARLYSRDAFWDTLADEFEGDYRVEFNLAPPLIAKRDPDTGHLRKRSFGRRTRTLFRIVGWGRRLRGTPFDIFGYTNERRQERRLIRDYRKTIQYLLSNLRVENYGIAVEIASLPEQIRGFGHVKEKNIKTSEVRRAELLREFSHDASRNA